MSAWNITHNRVTQGGSCAHIRRTWVHGGSRYSCSEGTTESHWSATPHCMNETSLLMTRRREVRDEAKPAATSRLGVNDCSATAVPPMRTSCSGAVTFRMPRHATAARPVAALMRTVLRWLVRPIAQRRSHSAAQLAAVRPTSSRSKSARRGAPLRGAAPPSRKTCATSCHFWFTAPRLFHLYNYRAGFLSVTSLV
jgi:hypothetical protein